MKHRINRSTLDYRILWLNQALKRPTEMFTRGPNTVAKMNVGHFHLQHQQGGYQLCEMVNENGGTTCPFGSQRVNAETMLYMLEAALAGIQLAKETAAKT